METLINIILIIPIAIITILIVAYFVKPELLTLPYSKFISLFVKNPPFVDKEKYFPESKILEDNWTTIRNELIEVLKKPDNIPKFHEVDSIQIFNSAKDDIPWKTYGIKAFNTWIEPNASMVPKTTNLIKKMPSVTLAMFSILDPGKKIPPHIGFFKGVFRYHLGLIIPDEGECYIINKKQRYDWKEGEGVLFDDTYIHEVWNKTENRRVVLFLDVYRDESLPRWIRPLNRKMIKLLAESKRIKKAAKKAEVRLDVETIHG